MAGSTSAGRDLVSLLSLLSHDLRGPLGPLVLAVSSIADGAADHDTAELARFAEGQAKRISRLIDAVLWVARGVQADPRPIRLDEVVADAAESLRARGVPVDARTVDAPVRADEGVLHTALCLLMDRAADEGGEVRVVVHADADHVRVSVAGAGWNGAPDGEPLASARAVCLAGADAVARAHGGRVDVTPVGVELRLERAR